MVIRLIRSKMLRCSMRLPMSSQTSTLLKSCIDSRYGYLILRPVAESIIVSCYESGSITLLENKHQHENHRKQKNENQKGEFISKIRRENNLENYRCGRLSRIEDGTGSGRFIDITYLNGRVDSVQDSAGRVVSYDYYSDGSFRDGALMTVTDTEGRQTNYFYVSGRFGAPLLSEIKDHWARSVTQITYYPYGYGYANDQTYRYNKVKSYAENGETWTYDYHINNTSATKKSSLNDTWSFDITPQGWISKRVEPNPGVPNTTTGTTLYTFTADGDVQQITDQMGIKTYYAYSANGNVGNVTRNYQGTSGPKIKFDYFYDYPNFPHKLIRILPMNPSTVTVDRDWQEWRYDYYQPGSIAPGALYHVYRVRSDGTTIDTLSTYTYNSHGQVETVTDATGGVTTYAYNSTTGDLISVTYPKNSDAGPNPVYQYGRDSVGRVTSMTDSTAPLKWHSLLS